MTAQIGASAAAARAHEELYAYWAGLRHGPKLPGRDDIRPEDFKRLLPTVSLIDVRRDPLTGDVILSKPRGSWDDYFAWVATLDLPADFLADRDQPIDELRDPFAREGQIAPAKRAPAKRRA